MPWDWMGIVTMRSETLYMTSTTGMIALRPGSRGPSTRPNRRTTPYYENDAEGGGKHQPGISGFRVDAH